MSPLLADNPRVNGERTSLPKLLGELTGQLVTLGKQEVQLAKSELTETAKKTATDSAGIVAGALIVHAGLLALFAAAAAGLAMFMPIWAALGIVGAVLTIAGGIVVKANLSKIGEHAHLDRFPKSLERNREFLKERLT